MWSEITCSKMHLSGEGILVDDSPSKSEVKLFMAGATLRYFIEAHKTFYAVGKTSAVL